MQASFVLDINELDYSFVDKLKAIFANKRVEVLISDSSDTDYLSTSAKNKAILTDAIANIEHGKNLIEVDSKLFQ